MKDKKLVTVLVIIVVLLLIGGAYMFGVKDNNNFLYSNYEDVLPADKLISYEDVSNNFLTKYLSPEQPSVCISTGLKPEIVKLFKKDLNIDCSTGGVGCQSYLIRQATVCGNKYIIVDDWNSGPIMYGIFELK